MGAHLWAMGADLAELSMSVPKIQDIPEGSPQCRLRTSRISESWLSLALCVDSAGSFIGRALQPKGQYQSGCPTGLSGTTGETVPLRTVPPSALASMFKSAKPADLPVELATKIERTINQDRQSPRPHHPGDAVGHGR